MATLIGTSFTNVQRTQCLVVKKVAKMNNEIKKQIVFVLEDDSEVMTAALDSDLDDEDKRMNRELIKRHEKILDKIDRGERLTKGDLQLIRDANEIHLNDEDNIAGHHKKAVKLNNWLHGMAKAAKEEPAFDDKGRCRKCGSKVSFADVTDTLLFVGDEIVKRYDGDITNRNCVKCHYPKQYADYEHYDK